MATPLKKTLAEIDCGPVFPGCPTVAIVATIALVGGSTGASSSAYCVAIFLSGLAWILWGLLIIVGHWLGPSLRGRG
jgi:hypothetical protein